MAAKKASKSKAVKAKAKVAQAKPAAKAASKAPATTIVQVPKGLPTNVQPVNDTVAKLAARAKLLKVEDAASCTVANSILVEIKSAEKSVKSAKEALIKPLKTHVKNMEAMFKPMTDRLELARTQLGTAVIEYQTKALAESNAKKAELESQAMAAQEEGDEETALALQTQAVEVETVQKTNAVETGGAVTTRMLDAFEVEDVALVPREYCTVDEKKIRAAMKAGVTEIPGVRFYKKPSLSISTGSGEAEVPMPVADPNVVDVEMEMN